MESVNPDDPQLDVIKAILNRDKIKLWVPPYTNSETSEANYPQELIGNIAAEIKLDINQVIPRLEFLRQNALEKLKAQSKFKETGIATIKAKVGGKSTSNNNATRSCNITIALSESGKNLKEKILDGLQVKPDSSGLSSVRLISRGKILEDNENIQKQGIRNGSVVMVLLGLGVEMNQASEEKQHHLSKLTKAAEILSSLSSSTSAIDDRELEYAARNLTITDQNGKPLTFPVEEKRNLVQGMALHDKARQLLKLKDHNSGLPLLLEADKCFSRCPDGILSRVDNYALLQLDVAWSYLCLSNISDLPDAEERLTKCEQNFRKTYGEDLSRAASLKGEIATTKALVGRLRLLQGILAYHKGDLKQAKIFLAQAESELQSVLVSPELVGQLLIMGFTQQEARLGLRACNNVQNAAVDWIMRRREERKRNQELVDKERKDSERKRKFGKTVNGKDVNLSMYDQMIEMGFAKQLILASLRQTDNNMVQAINMIETEPELLINSVEDQKEESHVTTPITDEMVAQVTALGFNPQLVMSALRSSKGSIERAVQMLVSGDPTLSPDESFSSSSSVSSDEGPSNARKRKMEMSEEDRHALEDLVDDLDGLDSEDKIDDHLDLTLEDEIEFLTKYKSLL